MSAAGWGLFGTVIGAVLAMVGNLVLRLVDMFDRRDRDRAQAAEQARGERKLAYLRLLTAARRLRYLPRPSATLDAEEIDSLRTELSTVNYEIALISSTAIASRADDVRRKTLDYVNVVFDDQGHLSPTGQSDDTQRLRQAARDAVDRFQEAARSDLGFAPNA
jgi:hypothetical protein